MRFEDRPAVAEAIEEGEPALTGTAAVLPAAGFAAVVVVLVALTVGVVVRPLAALLTACAAAVPAAGLVTSVPISPTAVVLTLVAAVAFSLELRSTPGWLLHASAGTVCLLLAGLCLHDVWVGVHPVVAGSLATAAGYLTWRTGCAVAARDPDPPRR